MAHNLMTRAGKTAMFCVGDRDAAWHRLGQRTPNAVTWAEAIRLADLDWTVVKKQLYFRNALGHVTEAANHMATTRSDDGAFLGIVGDGYQLIQNAEAFTFCDDLLAQADGAKYESAGGLGNGEQIWVMARIPEADFTIDGGDEHKAYLLVSTSHDGSQSWDVETSRYALCSSPPSIVKSASGMRAITHICSPFPRPPADSYFAPSACASRSSQNVNASAFCIN